MLSRSSRPGVALAAKKIGGFWRRAFRLITQKMEKKPVLVSRRIEWALSSSGHATGVHSTGWRRFGQPFIYLPQRHFSPGSGSPAFFFFFFSWTIWPWQVRPNVSIKLWSDGHEPRCRKARMPR